MLARGRHPKGRNMNATGAVGAHRWHPREGRDRRMVP
jgi:hypothetical protein